MKLLRTEQPPARPDDAAIWWATRRQLDPGRPADEEAFAAWVANEDNARAWAAIERRLDMVGTFATMPEVRAMRQAALDLARRPHRTTRRRWVFGSAIAASLAIGLISVSLTVESAPDASVTGTANSVRRFTTALGERRDIMLRDGSRITLNTGSEVEVDYGSAARRTVRLLRGQAMFQVARMPDRPFVVHAGSQEVTALGTAFDVRIKPDGQVEVLLVEGHVRVEPAYRQGVARLFPALARTELTPGQQLTAPVASEMVVTQGEVERVTAWNRGIVIFRDDSVSDAVLEMNRYSTAQLVVSDPRVAQLKVSGIFPTASRDDFVDAIEALYPVEGQRDASGVIRLRWRDGGES